MLWSLGTIWLSPRVITAEAWALQQESHCSEKPVHPRLEVPPPVTKKSLHKNTQDIQINKSIKRKFLRHRKFHTCCCIPVDLPASLWGDTFHFGDISFGILRGELHGLNGMTEFSNYSCQVWKHGFHSSHSLFWQEWALQRALSQVFWVILIHDRQGWPQMATVFCPDHHSKPRGTDSFSAQRMLGSSCWGPRPNEISARCWIQNSPNTWGSGLICSWIPGAPWDGRGQAQLDPHTLLEQSQRGHLGLQCLWAWAPVIRVSAEPQTCWGVHKTILQPTSP